MVQEFNRGSCERRYGEEELMMTLLYTKAGGMSRQETPLYMMPLPFSSELFFKPAQHFPSTVRLHLDSFEGALRE
jgi:hypothetical protein